MKVCCRILPKLFISLFLLIAVLRATQAQQFPEGFQIESFITDVDFPAGMVHAEDVSYVWELNGKVWPIIDGEKADNPIINIEDEVGFWNDHGLLSVVLHPDFSSNGYIYLLYVLDRYYLFNGGSDEYDPEMDEYEEATIGRLVRYTVDVDNLNELKTEDRTILIGTGPEDGIPITTISHGLGTVLFGRDKSLLISVGDANSPGSDYNGQGEFPELGYDDQALEDGILKPEENVGAFRSQFLNTYCGKILRINPETGDSYPSNPFYDPERPDEPISKVYALGFRNPFRMALIPGTGSENPDEGNPGHLVIGDVGDWTWEEINIATDPGQNFGWPIFQGPQSYYLFDTKWTPDYGNPLEEACEGLNYFRFQDLIVQPREEHDEAWIHPCGGQIGNNVTKFIHERPVLAYVNRLITTGEYPPQDSTVVSGFAEDGSADYFGIGDAGMEDAAEFTGISSVAGVFMQNESIPTEYRDWYIQADFSGWFRAFKFDEEYQPTEIQSWDDDIGNVVHISENPYDGAIYLASLFPGEIKRLTYAGNLGPVIEIENDTIFGPGPLTVMLDASASYDPEDDPLTYEWDFGDGTTGEGPLVEHTFYSENGNPASYQVELLLSDTAGNSRRKNILVSVNNTPPEAEISGFADEYLYPISQPSELNLEAIVYDSETATEDLTVKWDIYLHHNTHFHLEQSFFNLNQNVTIQPLGCGIETFWYRFDLTVTDPQGLTTKMSEEIFPNCESQGFESEPVLFPNPTPGRFIINYPQSPGPAPIEVRIFDKAGKLVKTRSYSSLQGERFKAIQAGDLAPGLYVVELRAANWTIKEKLVISPQSNR